MSHRFVRCPHCKMPHDAADRVCVATGLRIHHDVPSRPRRAEMPKAARGPDPFPTRVAAPLPGASGTLPPMRDVALDLVGATVGGRYQILGMLGEGGMGTVYDAEHLGLGRHVAIKVLNPTQAKKRVAVKRFQQEARAAGAIGHPNICEVYDMGLLDDGSPYLVMEKLIGQTLADRISKEGGLPFDELVDVIVQVLSGLIAAHDKGIVHRDIKPENIFLARRSGSPPLVKILDFGVSKMMPQFTSSSEEELDLTRTGMVMGTPYYMSPEQARGERNLDGRVDVYATGIMMYEAIAGKRPFLAPNYNALLLAIINTQPRPLREVRPATPAALEAVVMRAMAKDRGERYPSAGHLLRDMQLLPIATPRRGGPRLPPPPTPEERARATILGGNEPPRSNRTPGRRGRDREPKGRADGPGAKLRSRMNEPSTRPDITANPADSGSVEVTLDLSGSELPAMPGRRAARPEDFDDVQTEVFHPGKHPAPPPPAAPPPRRLPPPAPDDWEGETVVRRPNMPLAAPGDDRTIPIPARKPEPRAAPADIDFSDETRMLPPRRPPR